MSGGASAAGRNARAKYATSVSRSSSRRSIGARTSTSPTLSRYATTHEMAPETTRRDDASFARTAASTRKSAGKHNR